MLSPIRNALGIHEQALALRGQRAEILATNLANADTPNYKARDLDFQLMMAAAVSDSQSKGLRTTHARHIALREGIGLHGSAIKYRQSQQPAVDGNTVDTQMEQAAFVDNAIRYQATLMFLGGRIQTLLTAIREE